MLGGKTAGAKGRGRRGPTRDAGHDGRSILPAPRRNHEDREPVNTSRATPAESAISRPRARRADNGSAPDPAPSTDYWHPRSVVPARRDSRRGRNLAPAISIDANDDEDSSPSLSKSSISESIRWRTLVDPMRSYFLRLDPPRRGCATTLFSSVPRRPCVIHVRPPRQPCQGMQKIARHLAGSCWVSSTRDETTQPSWAAPKPSASANQPVESACSAW